MAIFFLVVFGIYFFGLLLFLVGWERSLNFPWTRADTMQTFSVIVPVRNEEKNIRALIQSVSEINYPSDKFELIIVDDHSADQTAEVAQQTLSRLSNGRVIYAEKEGKKNAITEGIECAKGEIILTTDADCKLPAALLQKLNDSFSDLHTQFVMGAVKVDPTPGFFSRLQSLEFTSLIGTAAASCGLGHPLMCNGANLAFRKDAFKRLNGYEGNLQIASGDDEFFMRKVLNLFGPGSIRFLNDDDTVVITKPQPTLRDFFRQRIRWASKWRYNTSGLAQGVAGFVFILQLSWIALLVTIIFEPANRVLVYLAMTKILLEGLFLWRVTLFLKQPFSLAGFFLLQILYPLYVALVGLLANTMSVNWKGRKII